jgi:hypothetical protein
MVGESNQDFPLPHIKESRNSLVTVGLPGSSNMWDGTKLVSKRMNKKRINMQIWAIVQDVLNGIAYDMRRAGAVYIYTDGYIFPESSIDLPFEIAASWGVNLSTRHTGGARVQGPGNYAIGGHKSGRYSRRIAHHDKVYAPHHEWLRKQVRHWSLVRGVYSNRTQSEFVPLAN